jgi:hypothetical protein
MIKINVHLEISEDSYNGVSGLREEIQNTLDWEGLRVSNVSVSKENRHKIYGSGETMTCYFQLDDNMELKPDYFEAREEYSYANKLIGHNWLHCTCGQIHNASEDEAVVHLQGQY